MATVLVVDDDAAIVRFITLVLTLEQLEVSKAYSGEQGLDFLTKSNLEPDLILTDLRMPGMGGREFFRQARNAGYAGPVIFCSAYGAAEANTELGGQGAIRKPFSPEDLIACVLPIVFRAASPGIVL